MIGKLAAISIAAAVAAGAVFLGWQESDKPGALFRPDDAQVVASGEAIYGTYCASCHGADLKGEADWRSRDADGFLPAPPHDETGHTWHHPDELLFAITKFGVAKAAGLDNYQTKMPVYDGTLSDEEIVAVLSYLKAQWPDAVRKRHDDLNANYAKQK